MIAAILAVVFIASGIWQIAPIPMRNAPFGAALVASGTAILFTRSWGYYLAYLLAFSALIPPQRAWLIPVSAPLGQTLRMYVGMEPELLTVLISLLCAGMLGWTHYALYQSQRLDQPLSSTTRRVATITALVISIVAALLPLLAFIYWIIRDPPGRGGPGTPGGGFPAFFVLFVGWPFMLGGVIGTVICIWIIKRSSRNTE